MHFASILRVAARQTVESLSRQRLVAVIAACDFALHASEQELGVLLKSREQIETFTRHIRCEAAAREATCAEYQHLTFDRQEDESDMVFPKYAVISDDGLFAPDVEDDGDGAIRDTFQDADEDGAMIKKLGEGFLRNKGNSVDKMEVDGDITLESTHLGAAAGSTGSGVKRMPRTQNAIAGPSDLTRASRPLQGVLPLRLVADGSSVNRIRPVRRRSNRIRKHGK